MQGTIDDRDTAVKKLEQIKDICKNGVYDEFNMPLYENCVILDIKTRWEMSKIEKQFFDAFDIEPNIDYFVSFTNHKTKIVRCFHFNKEELLYRYKNTKDTLKVLRVDFDYPEITDHILLELMCIFYNSPICFGGINLKNINVLREDILIQLTNIMNNDIHHDRKNKLKQQVQELFVNK